MSVSIAIREFLASNYLISLLVAWSTLISFSVASNLYQNQQDTIAKAKIEARTIFRHNIAYRKWSTMHGGIYTKISEKNKDNPHFIYDVGGSQKEVSFAIIDPAQVTKQAYEVLHNQAPNLAAISRTVSLDYQNTTDPYDQPDEWETISLQELEAGKIEEASTVTTINNAPYLRLLTPYIIDRGCINCHSHDFTIGSVRGGMSVAVPMLPYYETAVKGERTTIVTHLLLWLLGCVAIVKFSNAFKRYRNTIIESEKKFRILSEFACNFEYWLGQDQRLVFISPSCLELTGYSREEFINNPQLLETMIYPDDQSAFREQLNSNPSQAVLSASARIVRKNGEIRWFTHTVTPIYVDGEYLGRRGSSIDVTEQKKLEERLVHSKQLECMGQFAGGIAHDFNNVLGSINTFGHLLSEEIKDSNTAASDYVKYIKIATKLGKNLTSNLLSFGKKQIIEAQKTSLKKIVANISDILKSLVDESFCYLFEMTDDDREIAADPHQLEQILINLCTNARDAMPNGGTITIASKHLNLEHDVAGNLEVIPADEYMVLSVSDNGHGIKPENIKKICEPFFTTKSSSKGTGLGLSIIFNIVKQHKAYMDVESVLNQGTTFSIFMKTSGHLFVASHVSDLAIKNSPAVTPLKPVHEQVALTPPAEAESRSRRKTILLADDDELIRKALRAQLEHHGYQVLLAENGKTAIRVFLDQQQNIDMSILDVIMPQRNGKEVFDIIRKNNPEAVVLFISGNTANIVTDELIRQEGLHFMQKPIDFEGLMHEVESLIGKP
ncbi:MAG: ATP-binding protein [Desulfobulbaceae bacterium]|nr:ATP-binding protein [Desulfobulbaceae bacterium]